jgi:hypothetical protein
MCIMYVCVCKYVYVYYVCLCVCMYVCMYVCVLCMFVCTYVCNVCVCMYVCMYVYYVCLCVYVCMYVCRLLLIEGLRLRDPSFSERCGRGLTSCGMFHCVVGRAVPDVSNDSGAFRVCGLGGDLGFSERSGMCHMPED